MIKSTLMSAEFFELHIDRMVDGSIDFLGASDLYEIGERGLNFYEKLDDAGKDNRSIIEDGRMLIGGAMFDVGIWNGIETIDPELSYNQAHLGGLVTKSIEKSCPGFDAVDILKIILQNLDNISDGLMTNRHRYLSTVTFVEALGSIYRREAVNLKDQAYHKIPTADGFPYR